MIPRFGHQNSNAARQNAQMKERLARDITRRYRSSWRICIGIVNEKEPYHRAESGITRSC